MKRLEQLFSYFDREIPLNREEEEKLNRAEELLRQQGIISLVESEAVKQYQKDHTATIEVVPPSRSNDKIRLVYRWGAKGLATAQTSYGFKKEYRLTSHGLILSADIQGLSKTQVAYKDNFVDLETTEEYRTSPGDVSTLPGYISAAIRIGSQELFMARDNRRYVVHDTKKYTPALAVLEGTSINGLLARKVFPPKTA